MQEVLRILENQQEVEYLTYFVTKNKFNVIEIKLGLFDMQKSYKFSDESSCLNKLVDILFELKKKEKWFLKRLEKNK